MAFSTNLQANNGIYLCQASGGHCGRIFPHDHCHHHHKHQYNLHHHYTIYISLEDMVEAKDKSGSVTDEEESNDRAANSSKMEIHSSPGGSGGDCGDTYGEI